MNKIEVFEEFLIKIDDPIHREQLTTILEWVIIEFPNFEPKIAWNQPMFTDHGTFIAGFSVAKKHFAFAPEGVTIDKFSTEIADAGYNTGKQFLRILWTQDVNYKLLHDIIQYNIVEKANCETFWRK